MTANVNQKKGVGYKLLHSWQLYVLAAPTIIYLFVFNYIPMYGMQIAFRDFIANRGIWGSQWVGLKHFRYFFTSPQFALLLGNTIKLSVYSLLWSFPFPIILALMLNEMRRLWFKKFIQNLTYMPYFISVVVLISMLNLFLASPMAWSIRSSVCLAASPSIFWVNRIISERYTSFQEYGRAPAGHR
jgi:putative aldouronate transport system permease protein